MNRTPLTEQCSLFRPIFIQGNLVMGTRPETVNINDVLRKPMQEDLLRAIRKCETKDERDPLKKQLFGISPSSIQEGGRGNKYVKHHSGLLQFDIDSKENPDMIGAIPDYKNAIQRIEYTVYCGISASGKGLWGFFRISDVSKHAQHFDAMNAAFAALGVKLDTAPRAPASLRFLSYDPNAFFNDYATVFDKVIEPKKFELSPLKVKGKHKAGTDQDLIGKFNDGCTAEMMDEILINFGFNFHSKVGDNHYRYTRPDKDVRGGLSVDFHTDKKTLFCFSDQVPLLNYWKQEASGWSCSPVTALLLYGFGGMSKENWAGAFKYIKARL